MSRADRGRVQRPGRQRRQAVRPDHPKVDGKPAPEFDTFIWGWGGDPYDPSFLLSLSSRRRRSARSRTRSTRTRSTTALYRGAGGRRSTSRSARRSSPRWSTITQERRRRTSSSPRTRTCRPIGPTRSRTSSRPVRPTTRATSSASRSRYEPLLALEPAGRGVGGAETTAARSVHRASAVVAALVFGFGGWRRGVPPEPPERRGASRWSFDGVSPRDDARWLAGKVAAALLTLVFVIVFNFFLFRVMGDPTTPARPPAGRHAGGDREAAGRLRPRQAAHRPVRRLRRRHADARPRDQPALARAGLGRDQRRAPVDAASGRRRHAARDVDREPGWG